MPDGVLPRRPALAIVRELLNDVITDLTQRQHLIGGLRYRHGNEGDVRVRWLDVILVALRSGCGLLAASLFGGQL